jgi:hypothetical protein
MDKRLGDPKKAMNQPSLHEVCRSRIRVIISLVFSSSSSSFFGHEATASLAHRSSERQSFAILCHELLNRYTRDTDRGLVTLQGAIAREKESAA